MQKRGFTIIELLVVVGIIGILAATILLSLSRQQAKSRDARRLADITNINTAIQSYISEKVEPPVVSSYTTEDIGTWDYSSQTGGNTVSNPAFLTFLKTGGYMEEVPLDPINNGTGNVHYSGNGYAYAYDYFRYAIEDDYTAYQLNYKPETTAFKANQIKVIKYQ